MGIGSSRQKASGNLPGAQHPPPPEGATLPPPLKGGGKFMCKIPINKRSGEEIIVTLRGEQTTLKIPPRSSSGGTFLYEQHAETDKVFSSTLPILPGMNIVQSKPVIWATASQALSEEECNQETEMDQNWIAIVTGSLLENAQEALLKKTIDVGCNAVLGMTTNITSHRCGEGTASKIVSVATICGTPCVVVPTESPAVMEKKGKLAGTKR